MEEKVSKLEALILFFFLSYVNKNRNKQEK
jgi:hypothetical protein